MKKQNLDDRIEVRISSVLKKAAQKKNIDIAEVCRQAIAKAVQETK